MSKKIIYFTFFHYRYQDFGGNSRHHGGRPVQRLGEFLPKSGQRRVGQWCGGCGVPGRRGLPGQLWRDHPAPQEPWPEGQLLPGRPEGLHCKFYSKKIFKMFKIKNDFIYRFASSSAAAASPLLARPWRWSRAKSRTWTRPSRKPHRVRISQKNTLL